MVEFTIEEVEELLPEVAILVEEAVAVHRELQEVYTSAMHISNESSQEIVTKDVPDKTRRKIKVLTEELDDILEEIEDLGVELQDLDFGIVDFPAKFEGKKICFCWQLGEDKLEYWHEEEEGFSGRNKIIRLGD